MPVRASACLPSASAHTGRVEPFARGADTYLAELLLAEGAIEPEALAGALAAARARRASGGTLAAVLRERDLVDEARLRAVLARIGAPPAPGRRLGPYLLVRELGAGGMGTVFAARHEALGVERAVKVLPCGEEPERLERFRREGRAQAAADAHPNVVRVHALEEQDGLLYLAMDLAAGGDLARRIGDGPLPPLEAARLVRDLARGLAHVHAAGVLHRDIKPENVLFDEQGTPKLVDFGLAHVAGEATLTRSNAFLGTPAAMAPEQAAGTPREVDERTDVYGLGVVLYQCLTGRRPFDGPSVFEVIRQVLFEPPLPPRALAPEVPEVLEAVCLRALAKEREARYPGASALADDLERVLAGRRSWASHAARRLASRRLILLAPLAAALLWAAVPPPRPAGAPEASGAEEPAGADGAVSPLLAALRALDPAAPDPYAAALTAWDAARPAASDEAAEGALATFARRWAGRLDELPPEARAAPVRLLLLLGAEPHADALLSEAEALGPITPALACLRLRLHLARGDRAGARAAARAAPPELREDVAFRALAAFALRLAEDHEAVDALLGPRAPDEPAALRVHRIGHLLEQYRGDRPETRELLDRANRELNAWGEGATPQWHILKLQLLVALRGGWDIPNTVGDLVTVQWRTYFVRQFGEVLGNVLSDAWLVGGVADPLSCAADLASKQYELVAGNPAEHALFVRELDRMRAFVLSSVDPPRAMAVLREAIAREPRNPRLRITAMWILHRRVTRAHAWGSAGRKAIMAEAMEHLRWTFMVATDQELHEEAPELVLAARRFLGDPDRPRR